METISSTVIGGKIEAKHPQFEILNDGPGRNANYKQVLTFSSTGWAIGSTWSLLPSTDGSWFATCKAKSKICTVAPKKIHPPIT